MLLFRKAANRVSTLNESCIIGSIPQRYQSMKSAARSHWDNSSTCTVSSCSIAPDSSAWWLFI